MKEQKKAPFFARYLEGQEYPQVQSDLKAQRGFVAITQKYPSDSDEWLVTLKYPSDNDELSS